MSWEALTVEAGHRSLFWWHYGEDVQASCVHVAAQSCCTHLLSGDGSSVDGDVVHCSCWWVLVLLTLFILLPVLMSLLLMLTVVLLIAAD